MAPSRGSDSEWIARIKWVASATVLAVFTLKWYVPSSDRGDASLSRKIGGPLPDRNSPCKHRAGSKRTLVIGIPTMVSSNTLFPAVPYPVSQTVLNQLRASNLTWPSFERHVIRALDADLALSTSSTPSADDNPDINPYRTHATYIWQTGQPASWTDAFDYMQRVEGTQANWREVFKLAEDNIMFGGLEFPQGRRLGSGAAQLFYRWFAKRHLEPIVHCYDQYILTRSDHYWEIDHPVLAPQWIWVPKGQDWGGLCDRHMAVGRQYVLQLLDQVHDVLTEPRNFVRSIRYLPTQSTEAHLLWYVRALGLWEKVVRFDRGMYLVRGQDTEYAWKAGDLRLRDGKIVKYEEEFMQTMHKLGLNRDEIENLIAERLER